MEFSVSWMCTTDNWILNLLKSFVSLFVCLSRSQYSISSRQNFQNSQEIINIISSLYDKSRKVHIRKGCENFLNFISKILYLFEFRIRIIFQIHFWHLNQIRVMGRCHGTKSGNDEKIKLKILLQAITLRIQQNSQRVFKTFQWKRKKRAKK